MNLYMSDRQKNKGVRAVLLHGVFWRLLIIEAGFLVLSLAYRWWSEGAGPEALFWYGVRIIVLVGIVLAFMMFTLRAFLRGTSSFPWRRSPRPTALFKKTIPEASSMSLPRTHPGRSGKSLPPGSKCCR